MNTIDTVKKTIKKHNMLSMGDTVVVGVSGGADSICLLYILSQIKKEFNLNITAIHINHNLRGNDALNDEKFVRAFCHEHSITLKVFSIDVKEIAISMGISLEEAGRIQRYKIFNDAGADKIAVAHHLNDSCETMLMRLFRGTGLKGLTGILPVRDNIIRPLINIDRAEIELFCHSNRLSYCTDSTNFEDIYTRNKIRLHLIPWIKEQLNPNILSTLSKTGYMLSQDEDFLNKTARTEYKNTLIDKNTLDISKLKTMHPAVFNRVIRITCESIVSTLKDISYDHIASVYELLDKPVGKSVNLPYSITVIRNKSTLVFSTSSNNSYNYVLELEKPIYIKEKSFYVLLSKNLKKENFLYTYSFNYDKIKGDVHLRTKYDGDIFAGENKKRKLKKIFNDLKIPFSSRMDMPLLADNENVFCIIGEKIKASYSTNNNNLFFYVWKENDNERSN